MLVRGVHSYTRTYARHTMSAVPTALMPAFCAGVWDNCRGVFSVVGHVLLSTRLDRQPIHAQYCWASTGCCCHLGSNPHDGPVACLCGELLHTANELHMLDVMMCASLSSLLGPAVGSPHDGRLARFCFKLSLSKSMHPRAATCADEMAECLR
eukprot:1162004-Pelagomonas_calceolata.AAC.4